MSAPRVANFRSRKFGTLAAGVKYCRLHPNLCSTFVAIVRPFFVHIAQKTVLFLDCSLYTSVSLAFVPNYIAWNSGQCAQIRDCPEKFGTVGNLSFSTRLPLNNSYLALRGALQYPLPRKVVL